jgi:hypothetical protein
MGDFYSQGWSYILDIALSFIYNMFKGGGVYYKKMGRLWGSHTSVLCHLLKMFFNSGGFIKFRGMEGDKKYSSAYYTVFEVLILNVSKKLCFFRTTFTAPSC